MNMDQRVQKNIPHTLAYRRRDARWFCLLCLAAALPRCVGGDPISKPVAHDSNLAEATKDNKFLQRHAHKDGADVGYAA